MSTQFSRRRFVQGALAGGAVAGIGDFQFLSQLKPLSAAETKLPTGSVQFRPEIEPLVRLLEETPRDHLLEEVAARIRRGLSYQEILGAALGRHPQRAAAAGGIQVSRGAGGQFGPLGQHAVAGGASLVADFLALDYFKQAQAEDQQQGGWIMPAADEAKVPENSKARAAFISAMDAWDEAPADAAAAALARGDSVGGAFELLFRLRLPRFPRHRPQGNLRFQQLAGTERHRHRSRRAGDPLVGVRAVVSRQRSERCRRPGRSSDQAQS